MQKCFTYLKGKCEKGKDCGFTHSKGDPSKGDLEVQRRIVEKNAKESSGRDVAAGVVLVREVKEFMVSSLSSAAEQRKVFAMHFVLRSSGNSSR